MSWIVNVFIFLAVGACAVEPTPGGLGVAAPTPIGSAKLSIANGPPAVFRAASHHDEQPYLFWSNGSGVDGAALDTRRGTVAPPVRYTGDGGYGFGALLVGDALGPWILIATYHDNAMDFHRVDLDGSSRGNALRYEAPHAWWMTSDRHGGAVIAVHRLLDDTSGELELVRLGRDAEPLSSRVIPIGRRLDIGAVAADGDRSSLVWLTSWMGDAYVLDLALDAEETPEPLFIGSGFERVTVVATDEGPWLGAERTGPSYRHEISVAPLGRALDTPIVAYESNQLLMWELVGAGSAPTLAVLLQTEARYDSEAHGCGPPVTVAATFELETRAVDGELIEARRFDWRQSDTEYGPPSPSAIAETAGHVMAFFVSRDQVRWLSTAPASP